MWILVWLILAVVVGMYANNKGLSGVFYFFLSLVLSPLIGFVIAAVSQRDTEVIAERTGMKKCPDCAEFIQGEALVCRFCGHKFPAIPAMVSPDDQSQKEQQQVRQQRIETNIRWGHIAIAIFVLVTAALLFVSSGYITVPVILVVTLVLLLAFYPQIKRPGPAAHT